MALYTESYFKKLAAAEKQKTGKNIQTLLMEEHQVKTASLKLGWDIFLSHSSYDRDLIYGIYLELEAFGYNTYVDSIIDPHLDRTKVNKLTCETLRERMKDSRCLFFVDTENSVKSSWMPWELGYMDSNSNKVAILPTTKELKQGNSYKGREYLGLYPYILKAKGDKSQKDYLWIFEDENSYEKFDKWLV